MRMASRIDKELLPGGVLGLFETQCQKQNKHDRERERTDPMYSMIEQKTLVSCGREPARSLPSGRGFLLIPLILVSFAFLSQVQAAPNVSPPPDGCYPGFTTAEGCNALHSLTTGAGNT